MSSISWKPVRRLFPASLAGLLWSAAGLAALDIPDTPLFLSSVGVPPNIVLTLDDSGSMAWAFTPDLCGSSHRRCANASNTPGISALNPRYVKSSHYNPLYYNPAVAYTVPTGADGTNVSAPTFGIALSNGFNLAQGQVNLGTSYRPTAGFAPDATPADEFMNHYAGDLTAPGPVGPPWTTHTDIGQMIGVNVGSNAPYFVINDFVNADGSAPPPTNNPNTNLVSVQVQGQAATRQGNFTLPCTRNNDPGAVNQYYTNITGSTLTLCFRDDDAMYGKQVTVTHRISGTVSQVPIAVTANAPAYYYNFDSSNANCDGTSTDNDCYDLVIVSAASGPGILDLNGDGAVNASDRDERQNFANWYSFYRTRNLMTVSATALAFNTLPETTRVAWQALNSCRGGASTLVTTDCEGWAVTNPNFSNAIKPFTGDHKANFFQWLFRLPANGGTPLPDAMERAGDYYSMGGNNNPYDNDLDGADATEYSCRKNFHVMMTDGIWNTAVTGYGNYDSTNRTLPDDTQYSSQRPYLDGNSNSLADVAFRYWATDLRPGANDNLTTCTGPTCNTVPSYVTDFSGSATDQYFNPRNDPADWQHMVNFTVGLGLTPFLANTGLTWGGNTYAGSYPEILAGTEDWPATNAGGGNGNVADLWHAAINSRGKFYSADDPGSLVAAFQDIVDTISTTAKPGGGAGLNANTTQIDTQRTVMFEAKFTANWSGQLLGRPIAADGTPGEPQWDAGQRIPPPHARKIFTMNDQAEPFATCQGDLLDALQLPPDPDIDDPLRLCAMRLNWLRGDGIVTDATSLHDPVTNTVTATYSVTKHGFVTGDSVTVSGIRVTEDPAPPIGYNGTFLVTVTGDDTFTALVPGATQALGTYKMDDPSDQTDERDRARYEMFRNRQVSVLGDIVNSDPVYVAQVDLGYGGGSPGVDGKASYLDFVIGKAAKPPVLYVGANDGMLHGFCAARNPPYDPDEPKCPDNVAPGEEILAYVPHGVYPNLSQLPDPAYQHKYYVDGPISVSDAYIGGAIDGAWGTYLVAGLGAGGRTIFALDVTDPVAFSEDDVLWEFSDAADLGLTYSKPQIAPITASQWAVIFGNGYNSTSDRAFLYVIGLSEGDQIAKVATSAETSNGLSTPYLYDSDGDKTIDVVYAGDLQGNLWKFINTDGAWTLGNGGDPLFRARTARNEVQPITVQPKVAAHPSGGVLVSFGTGSYLSTDDLTNSDQQAFYAIWDKPGTPGTVPRSALQPYSIRSHTTDDGLSVRTLSDGTLDWETERGWYIDLPESPRAGVASERVVSPALIMEFTDPTVPDRVLFVTNTPSPDPCSAGGTTWLMEVDLVTGGYTRMEDGTAVSVFDLNRDGVFDDSDNITEGPVTGIALPTDYGVTGEPLLLTDEQGNIIKEFSGSTGTSGTAGGPLQMGEPPPPPPPPGGGGGDPTRIYWKQIL